MLSNFFALTSTATPATTSIDKVALILGIVLMAMGVFLIIAVLMQDSKDKNLSSAISGGSSDSFFSKSKTNTKDKVLSTLTMIFSIVFAILVVVMYIYVLATATPVATAA